MAKQVWEYQVKYPYGYSANYDGFHTGEDRTITDGRTDIYVPVNGHNIGIVGSTGKSTGLHLHIGKWAGGTHHHPRGGGKTLGDDAKVTQIDTVGLTANGKFVRVHSGGYDWVYLHLAQVNVKVGQVLKPAPKPLGDTVTDNQKLVSAPVFDWRFYLDFYDDLRRNGVTTKDAAEKHWLRQGLPVEGRRGNRVFSPKVYAEKNPDVKRVYGKDYRKIGLHWFNNGIRENRKAI